MPRSVASAVENNFINGFVTEATALNFPEAACVEADNCIFTLKGTVTRRLGFDFETNYLATAIARSSSAMVTYFWKNAAGDTTNSFVVVQVGSSLRFYKLGADGAISPHIHATAIDIEAKKVSGAPATSGVECQMASGAGYLFVVHPYCDPFYVQYDPNTDTFTSASITIRIRDFDGTPEPGVAVDNKTNTLTVPHKYNLLNQGWPTPVIVSGTTVVGFVPDTHGGIWPVFGTTSTSLDYVEDFKRATGFYPSNAHVWWLYKNSVDVWSIDTLKDTVTRGNSPAPRGKFVLDAFNQDRSAATGLAALPIVSAGTTRPSAVAFFAGRVWYSGVDALGFSNRLYFSGIVKTPDQFGTCYQLNDPTNEDLFDLLANDGGTLQILDAGNIIKLVALQSSLLVFTTNGVWAITGSVGVGFTTTDFSVRRLGSTPAITASSFVDVGGYPFWWNSDGIYMLQGNDSLGQVKIDSLTEKKIKRFYDRIPSASRKYAKGSYNPTTRVIKWVYKNTNSIGTDDNYNYDSVLNFNINTGAFYKYSLPVHNVKVNGIVVVDGEGAGSTPALIPSTVKYLCSYSGNILFSEESNDLYLDWVTYDGIGVDFESYLISGYKVHGDAQRKFQSNYVYVFSPSDKESAYYVQSLFDFASSSSSGRFSTPQKCIF